MNDLLSQPIYPPSQADEPAIQQKIDLKTKPPGALGHLETVARQVAIILGQAAPELVQPHLLVFAGDHGIAAQNQVNLYPQEVTAQMVGNFARGGAAINVFCGQHGIHLRVVDAGVCADLDPHLPIIHKKIRKGTRNYLYEPAMTEAECRESFKTGAGLVREVAGKGCNVIAFGEMGIGNTSSAALLMHGLTGLDMALCVGRGTGLSDEGLKQKTDILSQAWRAHSGTGLTNPLTLLQLFGGYEIAMMTGAYLQAAASGMVILVDGFIATAALAVAYALQPAVREFCVFAHCSGEAGHEALLRWIEAKPLLHLGLRLGEGTGAALAYPLVKSAVAFYNEMASFESAGVSTSAQ
ncbi:nicotinate-nucleotide--dimethylbenzimidazole phosphoribosyltransferase [Roseivirga sp. BDSF3-8]|uniref:nicotinate-nucleotide--dimethylbenzimidazole phosphoribosyltransferase n=1 Tax=Roseivirga sp. BDSF3-8 TaxID=3241598 RepID=UPI00353267F0